MKRKLFTVITVILVIVFLTIATGLTSANTSPATEPEYTNCGYFPGDPFRIAYSMSSAEIAIWDCRTEPFTEVTRRIVSEEDNVVPSKYGNFTIVFQEGQPDRWEFSPKWNYLLSLKKLQGELSYFH